jgi:glycosyltransferase involved in cell wall biosynthesis
MTEPKVSVIVPIYNQAPFIRETVDSVLGQGYPNLELVLSDDGSTDGTTEILHEYAEHHPESVKVVASDHNTGIAGAFNRALDAHTGEYIAWLGGDDVMLPGKLSRQTSALRVRPDAIGCCHDAEVFDSASGQSYGRFTEVYNGRRGVREGGVELLLDPGYMMLPSTMMVRSSAVRDLRFDKRIRVSNDWLFDIELFQRGRIVGLDDVLARYRRHQRNATSQTSDALEDALVVLALADARYPDLHRLIQVRRVAAIFGEASRRWRAGERRTALRYVAAAVGTGGLIRSIVVAARLVKIEVGRRRLGVTVPR